MDKLDLILKELKEMKNEVNGMKTEQSEMRNEIKDIKTEQQRHGDMLHQLISVVANTNTKLESMNEEFTKSFDTLENDIGVLVEEAFKNKAELRRLKRGS